MRKARALIAVELICLVLRAWGQRWISTDRAQALNTALARWALKRDTQNYPIKPGQR